MAAKKKRPEAKPKPKRKPRVRRSPEEARALIVAAAQRIIAARGPDAVGLKDVAREAGVSHALVSHYFGTYEGLVGAALESHARTRREQLMSRIGSAGDDGPYAWIEHAFAGISDPSYGRLAAWAMLTGRLGESGYFPRRDQGLRQVTDVLEAYLRSRHDSEATRDEIELVVLLVISSAFGYSMGGKHFWEALGREPTPERDAWFRRRLTDIALAIVQPKPREPSS